MVRSRRWIVVLAGSVGIVVVACAVFFGRERLEEAWCIAQLASDDREERVTAIARLGALQSVTAVPDLLAAAEEDASLGVHVEQAVAPVIDRVPVDQQVRYLEILYQRVQPRIWDGVLWSHEAYRTALATLKGASKFVVAKWKRAAFDIIESQPGEEQVLAARSLFNTWERVEETEENAAALLSLDDIALLKRIGPSTTRRRSFLPGRPAREEVLPLMRSVARSHPEPAARALALSVACVSGDPPAADTELLRSAILDDPSEDVRRAAVRIVGALGAHESTMPLLRLEDYANSTLLSTAIEARQIWTMASGGSVRLDLGFSLRSGFLHQRLSSSQPLAGDEIQWLENLLLESNEVDARDAASWAFAESARLTNDTRADLRVHEWSVWLENRAALEDFLPLPEFAEPRRRAAFWPGAMTSVHATVYCFAPSPVLLHAQVGFSGGCPRRAYPLPTGFGPYRSAGGPPWEVWGKTPSWQLLGRKGYNVAAPAAWYEVQGGALPHLNSLAALWTGLRVGYDLEALPEAGGDTSWTARRIPGASLISRGGSTDHFLHYDGAVGTPGPVDVAWEDDTRTALRLRHRSPRYFPPQGSWPPLTEPSELAGTEALIVRVTEDGEVHGNAIDRLDVKGAGAAVGLDSLTATETELVEMLRKRISMPVAELNALLAAWRGRLFDQPGLRVISIVPRWIIDAALPLEVVPIPGEISRHALAVVECDKQLAFSSSSTDQWRWPSHAAQASRAVESAEFELGVSREEKLRRAGQATSRGGSLLRWTTDGLVRIEERVATNGVLRNVRIESVEFGGGEVLHEFQVDTDARLLDSIGMSQSGGILVTETAHGTVIVVDIVSGSSRELNVKRGSPAASRSRLRRGRTRVRSGPRPVAANVDAESPVASANGKRVAYLVTKDWTTRALVTWDHGRAAWFVVGAARGPLCLSDDGSVVAFRQEVESGVTQLSLLYPDRSELVRLVRGYGEIDEFCVSGDGAFVAFASRCERDSEVFVVDVDAQKIENVTRSYENETGPQMSLNGSRLLVRRGHTVRVLDRASGKWTTVVESDPERSAVLSPDGFRVAYLERGDDGSLSARVVGVE